MTKVINSPFFTSDFAEYMQASGYELKISDPVHHSFSFYKDNDDTCVTICCDLITISRWQNNPGESQQYVLENKFYGISHLSFLQFAMLLDVFGVVSIKDNFRKTNSDPYPSFETLSSQFKPAFV